MSDCLFCKIEQGTIPAEKIFENEDVYVIRDIAPKADTHLLVIPRKHIASLNDLLPEDSGLMGRIMLLLPEIARQQGLGTGYRTIINTDKGGGQEIFHLHLHILAGGLLPFG